jgi:hypothetical protein
MDTDRSMIAGLLKAIYLFYGLSDEEVDRVASLFEVVQFREGDYIIHEGEAGDSFYIILEGQVIVSRELEQGEVDIDTLIVGDYFGEEALLYDQPRSASVRARGRVRLLRMDSETFYQLLSEYPHLRPNLARTVESRKLAQKINLDWLGDQEVIYQIRRKHEAILVLSLIAPFVICLLAAIIIFAVTPPDIPHGIFVIGSVIAAGMFLAGILWGIWNWIDWGNDYYIVTNQRVVWIEKIIGLYDSRDEIPLSTVLSVDVKTSQLERVMGYGNVIVRTFTGELILRHIGQPQLFATLIEEYWQRFIWQSKELEGEAIQEAIQERLTHPQEILPPVIKRRQPPPAPPQQPSLWYRYFGNFFKMRFEEGNIITYRKYWTILVQKTWMPTLLILILAFGVGTLLWMYFFSGFRILSPLVVLVFGFTLFFFFLLPWWAYHYVDWRNDIYQVTDKFILDIERKPFGTEVRKSAPLESILSLENDRIGFLGYLFNFGDVIVSVGQANFIFHGVHEPARVQQDIFNRMYALRRKNESEAAKRERDRIVEVVATYHQNAERYRQEEKATNPDLE